MFNKILTISIAAYNVEEYIGETLNSLLLDSGLMKKIEVLVIDDGSKDHTREITEEYIKKYGNSISLISKENGGWGSAVNVGIKNASGKYFRILDGDDWLETSNLKDFILFLEKTDADIVISPYEKVYQSDDSRERISRHSIEAGKVIQIKTLDPIRSAYIQNTEMTIKTSLLQNNNIKITEGCYYTDNELISFPLFYAKTITKFNKVLYLYRIGVEGQSSSIEGKILHYKDCEKVIQRLIAELKKNQKELIHTVNYTLMYKVLENLILIQYRTLLLMDANDETLQTLKNFDSWIKNEMPRLYKDLSARSKSIMALRTSRFLLYRSIHRYLISKSYRG